MILSRIGKIALVTAVIGAGFSGFSATTLAPAFAEPVRVEAPAAPGFADVVEVVSPAVVSVRVRSNIQPVANNNFSDGLENLPEDHPFRRFFREFDREFRGGEQRRPRAERPNRRPSMSQGSGFFISADGYIVTNNHVIENGSAFTVVMDDGTEYDAELIGADARTDLAVLKIDEERSFTYVEFADDAKTRVGDWVVAVGNPFGLGGTVTAGIVSAFDRDIGSGPYDQFIQIDAAVNRGNSGGPTFNLNGEVVGVNTAIFSPSGGNVGIAFAVPASVARDVVADLIDDGDVERGYLGVRIQPVTDEIAESLGLADAKGAIVAEADADTPASLGGIEVGDIITSVDGEKIDGPRELSRKIASYEPGTEVQISIVRNGNTSDVTISLGELPSQIAAVAPDQVPDEAPKAANLDRFGMTVIPSDDGQGLLITSVEPDSTAADIGLRSGDVISSVNNRAVASVDDLESILQDARDAGRKSALLRVEGENAGRFVAVPIAEG